MANHNLITYYSNVIFDSEIIYHDIDDIRIEGLITDNVLSMKIYNFDSLARGEFEPFVIEKLLSELDVKDLNFNVYTDFVNHVFLCEELTITSCEVQVKYRISYYWEKDYKKHLPKMQKKVRQHYIPQSLLKNFNEGNDSNYSIYHKVLDDYRYNVGVKNELFWGRPLIYTLYQDSQVIENDILSYIEKTLSDEIFKDLSLNGIDKNRKKIAEFYALHKKRVFCKVTNMRSSNLRLLYDHAKRVSQSEKKNKTVNTRLLKMDGYFTTNNVEFYELYHRMLDGQWTLLESKYKYGFISSDSLITNTMYENTNYIIIHLSHKKVILIDTSCYDTRISHELVYQKEIIDKLNKMVLLSSFMFVLYKNNLKELKQLMNELDL